MRLLLIAPLYVLRVVALVTKQERRLLTAHDDFFKCDKCGKWAWANKLGSLNLFSVGDQQILEAADSSGLLKFFVQ